MRSCRRALAGMLLQIGAARAQPSPAQEAMLAQAAARRFPQPVFVRELIGRQVLQPVESQTVLGRVAGIIRAHDGATLAIVAFGGLFGVGTRPIAVPIEAMVLVGADLEIVDFGPTELARFPTYAGTGSQRLAPEEVIRVGLAKPSH